MSFASDPKDLIHWLYGRGKVVDARIRVNRQARFA